MKRKYTPFWIALAVAAAPILPANETPAQEPAETPAAEVEEAETEPVIGMQQHAEIVDKVIHEARTEVANITGERDAALKEAAAVREAKQQLEQQLAGLKRQLEASNNEIGKWKEKTATLEKKLNAGEEAYAKLATFRDEMSVAMKEFATLKNGLADIRGELQDPTERAALKKELAGLKGSHEELGKKLDSETRAHAESRNLLAASEKHLADARTEAAGLKEAKAAVEQERDSARGELAATRETLASLQKESAQLRDSLKPLAAEIQSAKEQAELATAAIREANTSRRQAEKARAAIQKELDTVRGELASTLENRNSLQQQVAAKTTEIESLQKTIEELNARVANKNADEEKSQSAGL